MDFLGLLKSQWDRVGAITCAVVGGVFLLVGWLGVSDTPYLAAQLPYVISGGIGGIFFLGLGAALWISADLRDEWAKLDRIEEALRDGSLRWAEQGDRDEGPGPSGPPNGSGMVRSGWAPASPADQTTETPVIVAQELLEPTPARSRKTRPNRQMAPSGETPGEDGAARPARRKEQSPGQPARPAARSSTAVRRVPARTSRVAEGRAR